MTMGINAAILAADGCDDGVYEYDKTALLMMEDEALAQVWFAVGNTIPHTDGCGAFGNQEHIYGA